MSNLDVALDLAKAGAYVFPCQTSGENKKKPCRGVFWRTVSTNKSKEVERLWAKHPDAAPAIDLAKTGLLVIDCDKKPADGIAWLTSYAARFDDNLERPPKVDTPSTGKHLFFRNTFDPPHGNGRGSLPPKSECGIDVRGSGGYVVAPGAVIETGEYSSVDSIFDAPVPPSWLKELLEGRSVNLAITVPTEPISDHRRSAYGEAAISELIAELEAAPEGDRNESANRIAYRAGRLVGGGCLDYSSTLSALQQAALSWGISGRDRVLGPKGTICRAMAAGQAFPAGPNDDLNMPVEIRLESDFPVSINDYNPLLREIPEELLQVPGLVGEIAKWITDTALYPQPGLSLGAALTIVGTAAGRHIAGPLRSGTHLYIIGIAPSGAGKNHPLCQIALIMNAAGMRHHIGPSQFISMPAVVNFLTRSPLSICAMDEFGSFLKRINHHRASGFEGAISSTLRMAWGSSFSAFTTPEWAHVQATTIFSPALSIFGISTIGEFYKSLEGADISNGVLNRVLMIMSYKRPEERVPVVPLVVPSSIVHALGAIYHRGGVFDMLNQPDISPAFETIDISPDAEKVRRDMVRELQARGDRDDKIEPFLVRTAEVALRLATIVTIGMNVDCIEVDIMEWARDFAVFSSDMMISSAGLYIAESENQEITNAIKRSMNRAGGFIKRRDLIRSLEHKYRTKDLDSVISQLVDAERIVVQKIEASEKGGRPSYQYLLK